jgi:hypothetical protein
MEIKYVNILKDDIIIGIRYRHREYQCAYYSELTFWFLFFTISIGKVGEK